MKELLKKSKENSKNDLLLDPYQHASREGGHVSKLPLSLSLLQRPRSSSPLPQTRHFSEWTTDKQSSKKKSLPPIFTIFLFCWLIFGCTYLPNHLSEGGLCFKLLLICGLDKSHSCFMAYRLRDWNIQNFSGKWKSSAIFCYLLPWFLIML